MDGDAQGVRPAARLSDLLGPEALLARARAIKSEHKALGVVCFGYFRYRNARFGCAEVHQAIQALGRDSMTAAHAIAQRHGFRMVHELTDCAFLHKPGLTRDGVLRMAAEVGRATKVPFELEGIYRWLVLLPSKEHSTSSPVGVPNRYYGLFDDGTLKVRGIEVQRHLTPPFLHRVQEEMLQELAKAGDAAGFLARIPYALRVAKRAARDLLARRVPVAELGLTVQATRSVEEYAAETNARSALLQLRDAGTERRPGEYVRYVVTRSRGPRSARAKPVELLGKGSRWFGPVADGYDAGAYLRLLARQVETLLSPFGYEEEALLRWLSGRGRAPTPGGPGPAKPQSGMSSASSRPLKVS